jgi:hypothetical protein
MVYVQRRIGFVQQQTFLTPILEEPSGAGVTVALLIVSWLVAVQDQADYIRRVLLVELVLKSRADHVIRWSHYIAERADVAQIVTESAKGLYFGHGWEYESLGVRQGSP